MPTASSYVLGHDEAELRRLEAQARMVDPITRRFFLAAGVAPGMRVLDVGSGAGDTAILLSDIVGPTGEVVGLDRSAAAIEAATRRVEAMGRARVGFRHGDVETLPVDRPFDAVAGRCILMHMPDPAAALALLARRLRPNGILVFHEPDFEGGGCNPPSPTYDRTCDLIRRALRGSGVAERLGTRLPALFAAAGLAMPTLRLEAVIAAGPEAADVVLMTTRLATSLRPAMERLGLLRPDAPDFAEAAERILTEIGPHGTVFGRPQIGAWTRVA